MKNIHPSFTLLSNRPGRSALHRMAGTCGLFAALFFVPAFSLFAEAEAEVGREFKQDPQLTLPFKDNFDGAGAVEKFPNGWNGIYLDDDHNFLVTDDVPITEKPFTAPHALKLFSRGPTANGFPPILYFIVPKSNSLWLKFDFYFDPKDNYFRAGLGTSGVLLFGIAAADSRFFVISRGQALGTSTAIPGETSTAIPPEYFSPREWNSILIGRDENMGRIKINGHDIEIVMDEVVSMDYVNFMIGTSTDGVTSNLLIDNVESDHHPMEN